MREMSNPIQSFVPPPLGPIQTEYAMGENTTGNPEMLVEQTDPTVEAEEAHELEMKGKDEENKEEGEEVEAEEEEE